MSEIKKGHCVTMNGRGGEKLHPHNIPVDLKDHPNKLIVITFLCTKEVLFYMSNSSRKTTTNCTNGKSE